MLSSVARSPYICLHCRTTQLLRTRAPPLRLLSTYPALSAARKPRTRYELSEDLIPSFASAPPPPPPPAPKPARKTRTKQDAEGKPKRRARNNYDLDPDQVPAPAIPQGTGFSATRAAENVDASIADLLEASAARAAAERAEQAEADRQYHEQRMRSQSARAAAGVRSAWEAAGLSAPVAATVQRAFPNAVRMSGFQKKLVTALMKGVSMVAYSPPGLGKSFAIAAWLLTLTRSVRMETAVKALGVTESPETRLTTTALIIVPSVDLAKQYQQNVLTLLEATGSAAILRQPHGFVQALYRGEGTEERMALLREFRTPHILIATPTILLDILSSKNAAIRDLVDYNSLKTIIVEEPDTAMARYHNPILGVDSIVDPAKPKDPLLILLDYIFESRKVATVRADRRLTQPQLVMPTSSSGSGRLCRIIKHYHPSWLDGENRPGFAPFTGKGITSPSSMLTSLGEDPKASLGEEETPPATGDLPLADFIPNKLPDTISHHIVAYDPTTGFLRDAPVPVYNTVDEVNRDLNDTEAHNAAVEQALKEALDTNSPQLDVLLAKYASLAPEIKRQGYPPHIAAEIIDTLLRHDHYPRNVLAATAESASRKRLADALQARGIKARLLDWEEWNSGAEADHRFPLGRTDMSLFPAPKPASPGSREDTTVWITNFHSVRGLDIPGVNHIYILHRLEKVREYLSYAGRVGRWPLTKEETVRDARWLGQDVRPKAKAVAVVLEDRGAGERGEGVEYACVASDGGEEEKWVWKSEGLRLAKLGVTIEPYFGNEGGRAVEVEGAGREEWEEEGVEEWEEVEEEEVEETKEGKEEGKKEEVKEEGKKEEDGKKHEEKHENELKDQEMAPDRP